MRPVGPFATEDCVSRQHPDQPDGSASGPPGARTFAPVPMQTCRAVRTVDSSSSPPVYLEAGVKAENQKNASLKHQSGNFSAMSSQLSCENDSGISQGVPPRVLSLSVTDTAEDADCPPRRNPECTSSSQCDTQVRTDTILGSRQLQPLECEC